MLLAKKLAVDCTRFKDNHNDISSIEIINTQLESVVFAKRISIEELDGNRYES